MTERPVGGRSKRAARRAEPGTISRAARARRYEAVTRRYEAETRRIEAETALVDEERRRRVWDRRFRAAVIPVLLAVVAAWVASVLALVWWQAVAGVALPVKVTFALIAGATGPTGALAWAAGRYLFPSTRPNVHAGGPGSGSGITGWPPVPGAVPGDPRLATRPRRPPGRRGPGPARRTPG